MAAGIHAAIRLTDADEAYLAIQRTLVDTTPAELDELLSSGDLVWVRDAVAAVISALDERGVAAAAGLRRILPEHVAYVLLPY